MKAYKLAMIHNDFPTYEKQHEMNKKVLVIFCDKTNLKLRQNPK